MSIGLGIFFALAPPLMTGAQTGVGIAFSVLLIAGGLLSIIWHYKKPVGPMVAILLAVAVAASAVFLISYFWKKATGPKLVQRNTSVAKPDVPNANDVSPLISVQGMKGDDLVGEIDLSDGTDRAVTLLAYEYNAFGGHIATKSGPFTIAPYRPYPIEIEPLNQLIKTGRLTLRYDFKFDGDETLHKGYASFTIPEKPSVGEQIGPDECCAARDAPSLSDPVASLEEELLQSKGHVAFEATDRQGPTSYGHPPFQFIGFNPIARGVLFGSGPPNKQVLLVSGLARSQEHWIDAEWDVKKGRYFMAVDGRPARRTTLAEISAKAKRERAQQGAL